MSIVKNNLKGAIPDELSLLSELTVLNICVNDISGPLPPLNNLVNLTHILINNNDFDGVIPNISTLSNLHTLDISDNDFQGNLFDVGNLTQLKTFKVSGNKLSGEVPLSFRDIHLETLHLERTMLNGSVDFLCEHIPTMDIDLDCYDDIPEIQCNCCVGCTYVARECDLSSEVAAYIDITEAAQDFTWSVYSIQNNDYHEYFDDDSYITWGSNATERVLIAAGGIYDEGETVNINICLSFPGDYLLTTETNRTFDNDDVLSVGDYAIPLIGSYGGDQYLIFSIDPDGLPVHDVPTPYPTSLMMTPYPTTSPMSIVPTSSQKPTSFRTNSPTYGGTPTVGTNKTLEPTAGVYRPTAFPTDIFTRADATLCINIQLSTDAFGEETTYYIYKRDDTAVATKTSFDSNMMYELEECLDSNECYYFTIVDEFDDGICCNQGRGNYTVTMNGRILGQGGEFNSSETVNIGGSCSPEPEEDLCQEGYALLNVTMKADWYGSNENGWSIWSNNQIVAVNTKVLDNRVSSELVCLLETECYYFYLDDSYGDGWNSTEWSNLVMK